MKTCKFVPLFAKDPRYSWTWCEQTATKLFRKYARASDNVRRAFGLSYKQWTAFLYYSDPMWPLLRSLVHLEDASVNSWGTLESSTRKRMCSVLRERSVRAPSEAVERALTRLEERRIMEEQVFKGRVREEKGEAAPTEPNLYPPLGDVLAGQGWLYDPKSTCTPCPR